MPSIAYTTDTAIAAKYHELEKAERTLGYSNGDMFTFAGAKWGYVGRKRVPNMTLEEAIEKAAANVQALRDYMAANAYTEVHDTYTYNGTRWDNWHGAINTYDNERALAAFPKRDAAIAECVRIQDEIRELELSYTGWSRFFLVTSSPGHIHSSMHCSSCRPTTTYGWLPELSGKSEKAAVEAHGPALCSVCFPTAPVSMVGGKITAAKARKAAA